MKKLVQARI